jgi:hypothetical protein
MAQRVNGIASVMHGLQARPMPCELRTPPITSVERRASCPHSMCAAPTLEARVGPRLVALPCAIGHMIAQNLCLNREQGLGTHADVAPQDLP